MKEAIQKAIEGGWKCEIDDVDYTIFDGVSNNGEMAMFATEIGENGIWTEVYVEVIFSDPLFWQCLGKSLGWTGLTEKNTEAEKQMRYDEYKSKHWKVKWHSFIDHLASNGDPEEFFKQLLG